MGDAIEDLLALFTTAEVGSTVLPHEGVPEEVDAVIAAIARTRRVEVVVARTPEIVHLAWRPLLGADLRQSSQPRPSGGHLATRAYARRHDPAP